MNENDLITAFILLLVGLTIANLYILYRNTALVCGDNTILLYRLMKYEKPEECAKYVQTCQIDKTLTDLTGSVKLSNQD